MLPVAKVHGTSLIYWPTLLPDEQAFVAAYIENSYSLAEACSSLRMDHAAASRMLKKVTIRKAISEVQKELDGIDFLNSVWVKSQLVKLYPMVIGEEPVPFITNTGEQGSGLKFDAGVALKIIEYVAPKAQKQTIDISISNIHKLSDEQLEELASKGMERVVSEQ